jgi:hypothetical protein
MPIALAQPGITAMVICRNVADHLVFHVATSRVNLIHPTRKTPRRIKPAANVQLDHRQAA